MALLTVGGGAVPIPPGVALALGLGIIPLLVRLVRFLRYPGGTVPPGNLGLPFVGEMLDFVKGQLRFSQERARKFGSPFLTHLFFHPTIELSEDEDVKWLWEMERKGKVAGSVPKHIQQLLGRDTIGSLSGARHRALRRLMGPAFAPTAIRDYVDILDQTTRMELEKWASSGRFHSSLEFKGLALRLLFKCVFRDVSEELMQEVHYHMGIWFEGFNTLLPLALPGSTLSKSLRAKKRLLMLIDQLVEEFSTSYSAESEEANTTLLGRLIYGTDGEGNRLDADALGTHILTIIFAGHDTTYATLGSLLHNLSSDERAVHALTEEVSADTFKGSELGFDDLKNAPILNAVVAESWRKDPPVVAGPVRSTLCGVSLKQWDIPRNMKLQYNIGLCAYNEERYPQPAEFRVERFLPEGHPFVRDGSPQRAAGTADSIGIVFGGGVHSCLGSQFARLEIRVILTRMFQAYKVDVRNSQKVEFFFNTHNVEFRLTPRQ